MNEEVCYILGVNVGRLIKRLVHHANMSLEKDNYFTDMYEVIKLDITAMMEYVNESIEKGCTSYTEPEIKLLTGLDVLLETKNKEGFVETLDLLAKELESHKLLV